MIRYGTEALQTISYGFVVYALGMVMIQSFNGAGDTATPTYVNFFSFWLIEIPVAALLAFTTPLEYKGVFYSILISETFMAIIGTYLFRKGKWKLREV